MKFKLSTEFAVVVFLFVSIMIVSTYGSTKIRPFQPVSSKLQMYPYRDGFEGNEEEGNEEVRKEKDAEDNEIMNLIKKTGKKDEGFETLPNKLIWGDYGVPEKPLDIMSQLPSSSDCASTSCGLSNSRGYLCLSDEAKRLYKTRGGNSNGQPSQIGA